MTAARTGRARRLAWLALIAAGLACVPAAAQRTREPIQAPPEAPEVGELKVPPPAYPADADLVEFQLPGRTRNRYYVDGKTLSVGADKIVRFVMVVRSPANVSNVSFAGVNCKTREWKDYAFARTDRTWAVNEQAQWRYIQDLNLNNYQYTLFDEFFCYGGFRSGSPIGAADLIVRNLKYPITPDSRVPRTYDQQLQR